MTVGEAASASEQLLRLLGGKWISAAVSAAASLGLADALLAGPRPVAEIATTLDCDSQSLNRLLRVLAAEGLLSCDEQGRFALTEMGRELQTGRLRELAQYAAAPFVWQPWARLADSIRSGTSAFELHHGKPLFEYLDHQPADAETYHTAVDAYTRREAQALVAVHDFAEFEHVVDLGGGLGTLVLELLAAYPHLRGTLFDRPQVACRARERIADDPHAARCRVVGGDFFRAIPSGADAYVVRHVLHNWDDARASRLLQLCATAIGEKGAVLIIEGILLPGDRRDGTRLLDLEMLALCGPGRERSKPELRGLLAKCGLRMTDCKRLTEAAWLIVAR